jgi:vacuolar-type H+-ATPase subunit I/STV1
MKILFLLSLAMVIMLGGLAILMNFYTQFCFKLMVQNKYEVINEIICKETIPSKWRKKLLENMASKLEKSNNLTIISGWLKCYYLYKLDGIINFVKHNPVFKRNDREECVDTLVDIKEYWKSCESIVDLISTD